jgi:hypothetical protein
VGEVLRRLLLLGSKQMAGRKYRTVSYFEERPVLVLRMELAKVRSLHNQNSHLKTTRGGKSTSKQFTFAQG